MKVTDRCVCGHDYGDHLNRAPHARMEFGRVVCTEFRFPFKEGDLPDVWPDSERLSDAGERMAFAESAAADRQFQGALHYAGAFDFNLSD